MGGGGIKRCDDQRGRSRQRNAQSLQSDDHEHKRAPVLVNEMPYLMRAHLDQCRALDLGATTIGSSTSNIDALRQRDRAENSSAIAQRGRNEI